MVTKETKPVEVSIIKEGSALLKVMEFSGHWGYSGHVHLKPGMKFTGIPIKDYGMFVDFQLYTPTLLDGGLIYERVSKSIFTEKALET